MQCDLSVFSGGAIAGWCLSGGGAIDRSLVFSGGAIVSGEEIAYDEC
ncbi:MAG: hypothetical protein HC860_09635 [Alkalinema sp. RU_4_3]|nr:hypothetical protein [Alkalinema sp. RU_4_3]